MLLHIDPRSVKIEIGYREDTNNERQASDFRPRLELSLSWGYLFSARSQLTAILRVYFSFFFLFKLNLDTHTHSLTHTHTRCKWLSARKSGNYCNECFTLCFTCKPGDSRRKRTLELHFSSAKVNSRPTEVVSGWIVVIKSSMHWVR